MQKWKLLSVPAIGDDYDGHFRAIKLNSLGSLFWFTKYTLRKDRLTTFHKHLCRSLESDDLHLVLEVPMGMFKSTLATALTIWWSLGITIEDEREFEKLGYKAPWLRYMKSIHNQNARNFIAHEIDKRAVDIGKEVDEVYFHNDKFRQVFAGILPDKKCEWNDHSKYQKRNRDLPIDATNPTYFYCGVGHALQGIRADNTVEDDLFGKAAQDSMLKGDGRIVESTIRWHRQLTNRLDTAAGRTKYRQAVIGNRWGHSDLNSWIRQNQKQFEFQTHDAEGGCCELHPVHGVPIFPEEFSMEVLAQKKIDNTAYDYAHFFRNKTTLPEEQIFRKEWLRNYSFKAARPDLSPDDLRNMLLIQHAVYKGEVLDDLQPGLLSITILVDPLHAKKVKRDKHVIWSIGFDEQSGRIYLLNLWEKETTYSTVVEEMYKEYFRWSGTRETPTVYMSTIALRHLAFYLKEREKFERHLQRNAKNKNLIDVIEFEEDCSLVAMKNRIESLEPVLKNNQFWYHPSNMQFAEAVENYPACDLNALDALGNFPMLVDTASTKDDDEFLAGQQEKFSGRNSGAGGY